MSELHLVTGKKGKSHVTAADHGSLNAAIFGEGSYVLNRGNKFAASVVSVNQIDIADGDLLFQGRHIRLDKGTISVAIDNCDPDLKRIDRIVVRYTRNSDETENCEFVVIKGTAVASNPAVPDYIEGNIIENNALIADMPMYTVHINGASLEQENVKQSFNMADLVPDGSVIPQKLDRVYESIGRRTAIPSGANLDSYTAVGNYACTSAATAATLDNCPASDRVFSMTVQNVSGNTLTDRPTSGYYYILQTIETARGERYLRRGYQSASTLNFDVWKRDLTTDDVYSPIATTAAETAYAITANDIGKTVCPGSGAANSDVVYTLSLAVAATMPQGAEIAILYRYGKSLTIKFESGAYSAIVGDSGFVNARSYKIPERFGMVVLKKVDYTSSIHYLLVTGNAEVVS